ncbi:MAG: hypothetical protein Q7K43_04690 [Candidatus Woesearchaeota archaeon]|nr:hypothetical protein [Candidatus Woesearchaeota archaeon]
MSIENISENPKKPEYIIQGRSGVEGLGYSGISERTMTVPQAVRWASKKLPGGVLASVPESLVWRFEDSAERESPKFSVVTRSLAAYFLDKGKLYVMISHNADPKNNLVLANANQGYAMHIAGKEFKVSFKNKKRNTPLGFLREEAEKLGMIHELPEKSLELALNGEYANNAIAKSVTGNLGKEQEKYIAKQVNPLTTKKHTIGRVWLLSPEIVTKELNLNESVAIVRPCWAGGVDYDDISGLSAEDQFYNFGRARSVVHSRAKLK